MPIHFTLAKNVRGRVEIPASMRDEGGGGGGGGGRGEKGDRKGRKRECIFAPDVR